MYKGRILVRFTPDRTGRCWIVVVSQLLALPLLVLVDVGWCVGPPERGALSQSPNGIVMLSCHVGESQYLPIVSP